jgi:hypothetical protein
MAAMHVNDPIHGLIEGFATHFFWNIATVFRRKDVVLEGFDAHKGALF